MIVYQRLIKIPMFGDVKSKGNSKSRLIGVKSAFLAAILKR